ncbi:MAG TPA: hypothetical protein VFL83_17320 [Anaeromyxobacter sp.]|nr:hypothetical protein [Anaeromyxobacter sp.]
MNAPSPRASLSAPALLHPAVFAAGGLAGVAFGTSLPAAVAGLALAAIALRLGVMFAATGEPEATLPAAPAPGAARG